MSALTINTGSTSVRLARWDDGARASSARFDLPADADARIQEIAGGRAIDRIVHRVVHGGPRRRPVVIDATEIEALRALAPLAPNHNPRAIEWIEASLRVFPKARAIAVFDTAFFADLPEAAATYALPRALVKKHGLRRYGFHGLAHASMWRAWVERTGKKDARVITLQLGGGCSATAIRAGRPLDTSMGLTPLEGLVMATRAGDVDPGLVLHLQRVEGWNAEAVENVLAKESGLLGISGRSGDLRDLDPTDPTDPDARLALDVFVHRARKYIGAYAAVLEGIDGVVMGGGVSEHWPTIRARILSGFEWCGLVLDPTANAVETTTPIHAKSSRVEAWVVTIDEERELLAALAALPSD